MGLVYTVLPLSEETRTWIQSLGIDEAQHSDNGRFPTLDEIRSALAEMRDFDAELLHSGDELMITISSIEEPKHGPWASMAILEARESEPSEQVRKIYFDAGWDSVMIAFLEKVSRFTGPLILVPHSGTTPTLVIHEDSEER